MHSVSHPYKQFKLFCVRFLNIIKIIHCVTTLKLYIHTKKNVYMDADIFYVPTAG